MKKKTIVMICVIALAVICAGIIFFPVLQTEKIDGAGRLNISVSFAEDMKTGRYYDFDVVLYPTLGRKKISDASYAVDSDGTVSLSVTERGIPLFFPDPGDGYHVHIPGSHDDQATDAGPGIRRIVLNTGKEDVVVWEDGVNIHGWTDQLFKETSRKNADPVSVAETVLVMLSADSITSNDSQEGLSFALTFSPDSREITVDYTRGIIAFDTEKDVLWSLKMDSCFLLALFDELEKVNWNYSFAGERAVLTFSAAQASQTLRKDIKSYGKTVVGLQELTNIRQSIPEIDFD